MNCDTLLDELAAARLQLFKVRLEAARLAEELAYERSLRGIPSATPGVGWKRLRTW